MMSSGAFYGHSRTLVFSEAEMRDGAWRARARVKLEKFESTPVPDLGF